MAWVTAAASLGAALLRCADTRRAWQRHEYIFGFGGPHTGIPNFLITYHKVDEPADADAYVARIAKLGAALDQYVERTKLAVADGIRTPKFGYERTATEAKNVITGAPFGPGEDSPLFADLKTKIGELKTAGKATPEQEKAWLDAASAALTGQVKPAYERLIAWLESDMANAPSGKVGALTLPTHGAGDARSELGGHAYCGD